MEQSKDHCTLNNKELIEMAEACIQDLIDTGGGSFTMCVPARPNQDTDLILSEIVNRFTALQAKCDRYEKERYETRLALRMLLKAFKGDIKTERHKEWYAKAEAIFSKYHNVADVLRIEALNGEGEKERCTCGTYFIAAHGNCYRCPENQKEDKQ